MKIDFGNLSRVIEKLGLRLLDAESIRARGDARAQSRIRRAEARQREALMDAQVRRDKERIGNGSARVTSGGRLVSVAKSRKIEGGTSTRSIEADSEAHSVSSTLVLKQYFRNQAIEEVDRFLTLRQIGRLAEELSEGYSDDQEGTTKISDEFIGSWKEGAERSPDDETLRSLWARLLLGECGSPGTFSRRTINKLNLLSSDEARNLAKLGPFVISGTFIAQQTDMLMDFKSKAPYKVFSGENFLESAGLSYSVISGLETIGMISGSSSLGHHHSIPQTKDKQGWIWLLNFCGKKLLVGSADTQCEPIKVPSYALTREGRDILSLGDFIPNDNYIRLFAKLLKDRGAMRVTLADIVDISRGVINTSSEIDI